MKSSTVQEVRMHIVFGFVIMTIGVAIGVITGHNNPRSSAKTALIVICIGGAVVATGLLTT
jgi:hypothetical protein